MTGSCGGRSVSWLMILVSHTSPSMILHQLVSTESVVETTKQKLTRFLNLASYHGFNAGFYLRDLFGKRHA